MPRHIWTDAEREILRALYPTYSAAECAAALGLTVEQVNRQAYRLGLRKTREWIAERARERSLQPDHGGRAQAESGRIGATDDSGPLHGFWRNADWIFCRDGKWRPVEPGTFPLAHGVSARVVVPLLGGK